MLNINEEDLKTAIVEKAADEILSRDDYLSDMIAKEIKTRIDVIFKDRAEAQIAAAIDDAVKNSFEREYRKVTSWGEPDGPPTTIRAQLEKTVNGYWNAKVNPKSGSPSDSSYNAVTRAEYLMTQVCAADFTEAMKSSVQSVTGALKDGLRVQLARQMDAMLDGLFHIKSLQDQGKVEKPY